MPARSIMGGSYALGGTAGQADAGAQAGGVYALQAASG